MNLVPDYILPLLIYSGPLLPAMFGLVVKHLFAEKRYPCKKFFIVSGIIHLLAFVPFCIGLIVGARDVLHALFLPVITGVLSFSIGIIIIIHVTIVLRIENKRERLNRHV